MSDLSKSKSSKLKDYLFDEIFKENITFKYSVLREESKRFLKDEYSDGILNGILFRGVANEKLKKVGHGTYELLIKDEVNVKEEVDVKELIESSLKDAFTNIQLGLNEVKILDLNNEELMLIKDLKNILSELNSKFNLNL